MITTDLNNYLKYLYHFALGKWRCGGLIETHQASDLYIVLWPGPGDPAPAFPLLFHDNPASQTSFISISTLNTVFFHNKASRTKILANTAFRV